MNKLLLTETRAVLRKHLTVLDAIKIRCGTCDKFADQVTCALYEEAPPREIQQVGCDEWKYDGIPY